MEVIISLIMTCRGFNNDPDHKRIVLHVLQTPSHIELANTQQAILRTLTENTLKIRAFWLFKLSAVVIFTGLMVTTYIMRYNDRFIVSSFFNGN